MGRPAECREKLLLHRLFGDIDVTEEADQRGDGTAGLGGRSVRPSRDRTVASTPGRSSKGRTSTGPSHAAEPFAAHASAASRSSAAMTQKPPSCSLVSAKDRRSSARSLRRSHDGGGVCGVAGHHRRPHARRPPSLPWLKTSTWLYIRCIVSLAGNGVALDGVHGKQVLLHRDAPFGRSGTVPNPSTMTTNEHRPVTTPRPDLLARRRWSVNEHDRSRRRDRDRQVGAAEFERRSHQFVRVAPRLGGRG